MFIGKYKHTIDSKNRLTIPAKFINGNISTLIVSKGFDGCLDVRTPEEFNKFISLISSFSQLKQDARNVARLILSNSQDVQIDSQNRILLSSDLLKTVNINSNVIIVGVNDKFEIWSEKEFELFSKTNSSLLEKIAERLEKEREK